MKEQKIVVEIEHDGRITADAEGFSGDACLKELERLLDGLSPGTPTITRKADPKVAMVTSARTQTVGKKS